MWFSGVNMQSTPLSWSSVVARFRCWSAVFALACVFAPSAFAANQIERGQPSPTFELPSAAGEVSGTVRLAEHLRKGPVVVTMLRGYPGYQCPICTRQVGEFIKFAPDFAAEDAKVFLIYPGPAEELRSKADEFTENLNLPAPITLVIDPDMTFVTEAGLRWDAPGETAYPATWIIGSDGKVQWAKVSQSHGGRATAREVMRELRR